MNITLCAVGKIKEAYLRDAIDEYKKRLSRYCNLTILEVQDEKTKENSSAAEEEKIKNTEGERLLRIIKEDAYVIALEITGKMLDSIELSADMQRLMVQGIGDIIFVIGGSIGLSEAVLKRADYKLSFSKMTFPHQLMRVILLEQVYRCFRIMKNEPYHK